MIIGPEDLDRWFTYHAPNANQTARYQRIRQAAREFAGMVLSCTPPGPDQTAAIRKIREAVMTANAAIACDE